MHCNMAGEAEADIGGDEHGINPLCSISSLTRSRIINRDDSEETES